MSRTEEHGSAHILTIDVEEYFQARHYGDLLLPAEWKSLPSRAEHCVEKLLQLLERYGHRATFFVDEWIAESRPDLTARIARAGHEVGIRGDVAWWGEEPSRDPGTFRRKLASLKMLLEAVTGSNLRGFRSRRSCLPHQLQWVYDALVAEGFYYDSSVKPTRCRREGHEPADRRLHTVTREGGELYELPRTTTRLLGIPVTAADGRSLRQAPFWFTRSALSEYASRDWPAVVAIRSWEVDPHQPDLGASTWRTLLHTAGIRRTTRVLERLFSEFDFVSAGRFLDLPDELSLARDRMAPGEPATDGGDGGGLDRRAEEA